MFAAGKTKGAVATAANYIEDVFSTWLYTGTGATQTITNNIDTTTYGGLTWIKSRSAVLGHRLTDTARGVTKSLASETTAAQATETTGLTAFGTTGFTIGADADYNTSAATYASWTFRKQPKFFDVVTFTANTSTSNQRISHNLGSTPGCILIKSTNDTLNWYVYHQSLGRSKIMFLNTTGAQATATNWLGTSNPTSTDFGFDASNYANAGDTFVAYLFADNAGGFGLTGTDNVISCGSYVGNASNAVSVTLGYEPQWVMIKSASTGGATYNGWVIFDNMRGIATGGNDATLFANQNWAENQGSGGVDISGNYINLTSTGFSVQPGSDAVGTGGTTYIYIAIRRGPMKVPTDATKVYYGLARAGTGTATSLTTVGFAPDLVFSDYRNAGGSTAAVRDKLRGRTKSLYSGLTDAEATYTDDITAFLNNGISIGSTGSGSDNVNGAANTYINWFMGRAPSFFDEVCYTEGSAIYATNHNLGVLPELIIYKTRSAVRDWFVYYKNPSSGLYDRYLNLNLSDAASINYESMSTLTSTTIPAFNYVGSGTTDVAYLFATCAGVSKVGSYTGNGTTQTINCGFTGGARFVLIKRTDATGDWYVYDTARGMTTLTDPYLRLNSTAAETATLGSVTTVSTGFAVNAAVLAAINTNGASYIYLSIA
jgi:hypothetical protein